VRTNRSLKLVLVLVLALLATAAIGATGCSLTEAKDKAALLAALTEFKTKSAPLGLMVVAADKDATVTSDGTEVSVAIKDGFHALADEWQSVVDKAGKVEEADAEQAEKVWSDLEAAVDEVPAGATAGEAGAIIGVPLQELMTVSSELTDIATSLD
jgi:hypothetical protein